MASMKLHCNGSSYQSDSLTFTTSKHWHAPARVLFSGPCCFWSTLTILLIPVISCHSFFADDMHSICSTWSNWWWIQILNSELAKVAEWFDSNKLTLNVNKTQMLMMCRKKNLNPQGDVILHNEAIHGKAKFLVVKPLRCDQGKILRRNC